jgi:hypothetical protein
MPDSRKRELLFQTLPRVPGVTEIPKMGTGTCGGKNRRTKETKPGVYEMYTFIVFLSFIAYFASPSVDSGPGSITITISYSSSFAQNLDRMVS